MSLEEVKSFVSKYVILPVGINATAGAMAGVLLKAPALTTLVSGTLSGVLQSVATVPRNWVLKKIDMNTNGVAKVALVSATFFIIYAVQIPLLMGTSVAMGTPIAFRSAVNLTLLGGGVGALEYNAAQYMVDKAASGEKVDLI